MTDDSISIRIYSDKCISYLRETKRIWNIPYSAQVQSLIQKEIEEIENRRKPEINVFFGDDRNFRRQPPGPPKHTMPAKMPTGIDFKPEMMSVNQEIKQIFAKMKKNKPQT